MLAASNAERALLVSRRVATRQLDRLQLRLRAVVARRDQSATEWVGQMKAKLADGSIWEEIKAQRSPDEIVTEWRRSRSA